MANESQKFKNKTNHLEELIVIIRKSKS